MQDAQDGSGRTVVALPSHEDEKREKRKMRLQSLTEKSHHMHRRGQHRVEKRVEQLWQSVEPPVGETAADDASVDHVEDENWAMKNSKILIPLALIGIGAVVVFSRVQR